MKTILSLIGVGILWGATNPLIRKGSKSAKRIEKTPSKWRNIVSEIFSIVSNVKYWVPFLLNQCGSVLFVYTLQDTPLTVTVPVANSLSFVFTAITGYFLGEGLPGKKIIIGTILVSLGSFLLMYGQLSSEKETPQEIKFQPPDH